MNLTRAVLIAGMVTLTAVVYAQSSASVGAWAQPCSKTLKYNPDNFTALYTKTMRDESELSYDDAALTWAGCKEVANLKQLSAHRKLRARLLNLRSQEIAFFNAETTLTYAAMGGGTLYTHGRARFQPDIELHVAKLIALTTAKSGAAQSNSISVRYAAAKKKLEARIQKVQTPFPFTDSMTPAQVADRKKIWLGDAKEYKAAYLNIRKTIGSRVDATSVTIIEFLAAGLWAEEL